MKFLYSFISSLLIGALIAFCPVDGTAGTVGKITGVVTDATGQPLPGANVVIEGTQRGATTDSEGYYLILSVEPGAYELTASMVGYAASTRQGVTVNADFTTTVDVTLEEATLEAAEMVVTAQRPLVEPDRTSSRYIIDLVDIQSVPLARNTADLLELSPGVSMDGELRIRGSHTKDWQRAQNETYMQLDGIRVTHNDSYYYDNFMGFNKSALQEISVITGGMDAEYGNAQAGVISMVTKEGGSRYAAWGEYRLDLPGKKHWGANVYDSPEFRLQVDLDDPNADPWSDADFLNETDPEAGRKVHARTDYTDVIGHFVEGTLGGPVAENIGFFASARHSRQAPHFPNALNREPFNFQTSGSFTFRPVSNLKLKLGGLYAYYEGFDGTQREPSISRGKLSTQSLFLPEGWSSQGKRNTSERILYLIATQSLSPKTFYDLRISYQQSHIDPGDVPAVSQSPRQDSFGFSLPYDLHKFEDSKRTRYLIQGELTSQLNKHHLAKGGFEITRYGLLVNETNIGTSSALIRLIGKGDPVVGFEPFHPIQYAAYVQDKMEFEGLVVNAGVRFDALSARQSYERESTVFFHYNSLTRFRNAPLVDTPTITSYSPRLGISHPITERSTVRFFTGRFTQYPDVQKLYDRNFRGSTTYKDLNGNGQIDEREQFNTLKISKGTRIASYDFKPERTTSFEAGFDWNFAGNYIASVGAFYKDQEGQVFARKNFFYPSVALAPPGETAGTLGNRQFSMNITGGNTSRGFELSFKKSFSSMTSFNLSYNLQWVRANTNAVRVFWLLADPSYVNSDRFFFGVDVDPTTGQETPRVPTAAERAEISGKAESEIQASIDRVGTPFQDGRYLDLMKWDDSGLGLAVGKTYRAQGLDTEIDRRNYASLQFLFSTPSDFHIKPLAGFRATMLWRLHSGLPYNYTPPAGARIQQTGPISSVTDLNLEKDFRIGNASTATAFAEVQNLWNQKDDLTVGFNYVQYALQMAQPGDSQFQKYGDVNGLARYDAGLGQPRRVVLGARVSF